MQLPLAFIDLETTGATATVDRITEIGIVEVGADGIVEWSSLVNPQTPISDFIERLTGISDAMVAGAPTFAELADEIRRRLDGRLFIAHNARFDYGFLKNEFKRLGIDFRATVLCTVKLSRKLQPQHQRHNLDSLIARHGLVADGRHRALADARLIHQLWEKLHAQFPAERIEATVRELTARPILPPQLDAGCLDDLPEGHGVYILYGDDDLPLRVGRNRQLRQRVIAHLAGDRTGTADADLARQVRRVEAIATAGEIGALLLEAGLIRRLQPVHHRPGPVADELCCWRLHHGGHGEWVPELVLAEDIDFAAAEDVYGLFPSRRDARRSLQQIARDQALCLVALGLEAGEPGRACQAYPLGRCAGACLGRETVATHGARLLAGLARLKLMRWPFAGPALLDEGETLHVIDRWRYLGSARCETDLWGLLDNRSAPFDRETYRALVKSVGRMRPLPAPSKTAAT